MRLTSVLPSASAYIISPCLLWNCSLTHVFDNHNEKTFMLLCPIKKAGYYTRHHVFSIHRKPPPPTPLNRNTARPFKPNRIPCLHLHRLLPISQKVSRYDERNISIISSLRLIVNLYLQKHSETPHAERASICA